MDEFLSLEVENYIDKLLCGVVIVDIETRKIMYTNQVALKMLEQKKEDVVHKICHEFICPAKRNQCPIIDKGQEVDCSEKILLKGGKESLEIIKSVSKITIHNKTYLLESFVDISFQKKLEKRTELLGMTDSLTGLYNRRYLTQASMDMMKWAAEEKEAISVVLLDADHFKSINDNYGHLMGDQVLVELGAILKKSVKKEDIVIRWGGEEFLIFLRKTGNDQAILIAENIRSKIEAHKFPHNEQMTVCLGIAEYLENESYNHWIDRADYSMMRAKAEGRNQTICWNGFLGLEEIRKNLEIRKESTNEIVEVTEEYSTFVHMIWNIVSYCVDMEQRESDSDTMNEFVLKIFWQLQKEEEYIAKIKYPEAEMHREKHYLLRTNMNDFLEETLVEQKRLNDIKLFQLVEKLILHFREEDVKIIQYVKGKQTK